MSRRIDLHEPVFAICRLLGIEPTSVGELTIRPGDARAIVYTSNEEGRKYINRGSGGIVAEIHTFQITTWPTDEADA